MKRHSGFLRVYAALEAVGGGGVAKLEPTFFLFFFYFLNVKISIKQFYSINCFFIYFVLSPLFYPLALLQLLLARSSHIKSRTKAVTHSNIQRLKIS